jgi:hypothetical protein
MASLTHYFTRAKNELTSINNREIEEVGEDMAIAGATGAALALMSTAIPGGSMDYKVAGIKIPIDAALAVGVGIVGKATKNKQLSTASVAAGGAAAARLFAGFFKSGLGSAKAHGMGLDFDQSDIPFGMGAGWGNDTQDELVNAARYL